MEESAADAGPYLLTSVFCQKILGDDAGNTSGVAGITTKSAVDVRRLTGHKGPVRLELKLLILLVAGNGRGGSYVVELQAITPAGKKLDRSQMPIRFGPQENSIATIVVDYGIDFTEPGLYWVDVYLTTPDNGPSRLLTRMPLEFEHQGSLS
jgi:hypothetical protein